MHFLYVAQGESGLIKVGLTTKPKQRGYATALAFKRRGDKLARIKICPPTLAGFGVESSVCYYLATIASKRHGREWFVGLSFDETYEYVLDKLMDVRYFQMNSPMFVADRAAQQAALAQPA